MVLVGLAWAALKCMGKLSWSTLAHLLRTRIDIVGMLFSDASAYFPPFFFLVSSPTNKRR